jgi:hypothetical protein
MDPTHDPETVLRELDPDRLAERVKALDGERRALMVLLRAARARRKGIQQQPAPPAGVRHAS